MKARLVKPVKHDLSSRSSVNCLHRNVLPKPIIRSAVALGNYAQNLWIRKEMVPILLRRFRTEKLTQYDQCNITGPFATFEFSSLLYFTGPIGVNWSVVKRHHNISLYGHISIQFSNLCICLEEPSKNLASLLLVHRWPKFILRTTKYRFESLKNNCFRNSL